MLPPPLVEEHPDGFKATWPGFPKAFALFSVEFDEVVITDIFRDPAQPKGVAGKMLAAALLKAGAKRQKCIRIAKILDTQLTLTQLHGGIPIPDTVLGRTLANCITGLGGRATAWQHGVERGKPWIEATVEY